MPPCFNPLRGLRAALLVFAAVLFPLDAAARANATWTYSFEEIYSTAVRFIRIDQSCLITDRDAQAAYLIFECKEGSKVKHGALEIFRQGDAVRVQLSLMEDPLYMETRLLDLLQRKLRDERGTPPSRERKGDRPNKGEDKGDKDSKRDRDRDKDRPTDRGTEEGATRTSSG